MSGNTNKVRGYTLVELIVVIALIAIVLSIAIPSIRVIFITSEKKELMEFKRDLIFARNSAVMENSIYTIEFNLEKNQYSMIRGKGINKIVTKEKKFVNGIKLKNDNLDHYVTFYATGSPEKAGTIELTNKNNDKIYITVVPATGKINLKFNSR